MTTTTTSGAADLLDLIEAYAEARHRQGHCSYNAQTAAALQAVKDALAAGQAVVQDGWKLVPAEPTQSMLRAATEHSANCGGMASGRSYYLAMLAASPTPPAEQTAITSESGTPPAEQQAQPGASYAALPEKYYLAGGEVPTWDAKQIHAFADATHALRVESLAAAYCEELDKLSQRNYEMRLASHGQAPAGAARADSGLEDAAREPLQIFDSPRAKSLMRAFEEGWAACRDAEFVGEDAQNDAFNQSATVNVCLAEDWTAAAERAARDPADSLLEDAARYRWLREGNDAKHGAAWHVAVNLYGCEWDAAIDAAMNKGANHDR